MRLRTKLAEPLLASQNHAQTHFEPVHLGIAAGTWKRRRVSDEHTESNLRRSTGTRAHVKGGDSVSHAVGLYREDGEIVPSDLCKTSQFDTRDEAGKRAYLFDRIHVRNTESTARNKSLVDEAVGVASMI